MHYAYILTNHDHTQRYIGSTRDLKARLIKHNEGGVPHTAKFKPWNIAFYAAFSTKQKAIDFEKYLKSGSGFAFANKRLL